jgi:hypothetical protein
MDRFWLLDIFFLSRLVPGHSFSEIVHEQRHLRFFLVNIFGKVTYDSGLCSVRVYVM